MDKSIIRNLLMPELDLVESEEEKDKILSIWQEAIAAGGWEDLDKLLISPISIYVNMNCPENCFTHTRNVTALANAVYDTLTPLIELMGAKCSKQDLIEGALLHDVGKLTEMDIVNGENVQTHFGDLFTHPVYGAYLAQKHGIRQNVVHMILTHSNGLSPQGAKAYNTPESLILKYLDDMTYRFVEMHYKK